MITTMQAFEATLQEQNLSLTKPRRYLFKILEQNGPMTMNELVGRAPNFDRSSVYRTISLFEKIGITHRLPMGWKYKIELTNSYQPHHHHLTCLVCDLSISFLESRVLENALEETASRHDFSMQNHQIELQGICKNCKT